MENNDKIDVATRTKLGEVEVKSNVAVNFVGEEKVTRVLTASVRPVVANVVSLPGSAKFDGEIWYDFLVVLESGEVVPVSESTKFEASIEDNLIKEGTDVSLDFEVGETSSNSSGEYATIVKFSGYIIETSDDLFCALPPEGVMVKEEDVFFDTLVANGSYEGKSDLEITKDNKASKILFVRSFGAIKSIVPSNDYFAVSGEIYSTIVTENSEGQIRTQTKESSFSEEVEAKGVTKESNVQTSFFVNETTIKEDENNFVIEVPFKIDFSAFNKNETKCVCDAYSLTNEVNLTTSSLVRDEFATTKLSEENLLTNFTLSQDILSIDKILAVIPLNLQVVNSEVRCNETLLEGIASVNIVYNHEDDDGNNVLSSVDVEVPYSICFATPDTVANDSVRLEASFGDINVKARHGKELEILCEIKLNYSIARQCVSTITTEIVVGEEKEEKGCALEIYVVRENETLWDVAKRLNITMEDLLVQNGELTLPLQEGQKIVAYRRLMH